MIRPRRNRSSAWIRNLIAENNLSVNDLIMPFFVTDGTNFKKAISALPGQFIFSIDLLLKEIKKAKDLGIPAIMIFPETDAKLKTADGKEALNSKNLICRAVKEIKKQVPGIGVICDVALDPYTSHGHDGVLNKNGDVANDATVEILCQQALVQAKAGCDAVAPSDMMDGRIAAIREYLDKNGFQNVGIISYCVKYASHFYGAFRNAIGSSQNLKKADKKTYQMDFRNCDEALREIKLDEKEGADMLIIKPGISYLDIVVKAKQNCNLPIISYQVGSEYSMLKLAAKEGLIDFNEGMLENLTSFKRAGASAIISYGAIEMAEYLA